MEVILKQDVKNLGYADEIVKVKDGYARNYLIPQGFAVLATEPNRKMLAETIKQRAFKAEKIRKEAEFLAGKIEGLAVKSLPRPLTRAPASAPSPTSTSLKPSRLSTTSKSTAVRSTSRMSTSKNWATTPLL